MQLFHWEPNGACARVLITLAEKGVPYEGRWVDIFAREQHQPDFTALNPSGELPVLVRDGQAFTQSSYICEYLDEVFPDHPLMPATAPGRWEARGWQKYVDDYFAAAVSDLAWAAYRDTARAAHGAAIDAAVEGAPTPERRQAWKEAAEGYPPGRIDAARERVMLTVAKIEEQLGKTGWLAGDAFTLADIAVYAYAGWLPRLMAGAVSAVAAPRTADWLSRMAARPGVRAALATGRSGEPFVLAAPGPEHIRWG